MRRTTTHDSRRPDGLLGDVVHEARGRDVWTGADGSAVVVSTAAVDARTDPISGHAIRSITCDPPEPAISDLSGQRATAGFRQAVETALPDEDRTASLRYQLLYEMPIALTISGVAIGAAGLHPPPGSFDLNSRADICAGFVTGGELLVTGEQLGHPPVSMGPSAPDLTGADDPDAWHPMAPLGRHGMRRGRRVDVWDDGGGWAVDAFFRDSRADGDGAEWVVHEYTVRATLDREPLLFRTCQATVGVLPWRECPGALSSAARLVGTGPGDLRDRVRQSFTGTSTCTHLNDTLGSLAVLPYLIRLSVDLDRTPGETHHVAVDDGGRR